MAVKVINPAIITWNTAAAVPATEAVDANDGATIDCSGFADSRLLITMENADAVNAEDVTIVKGNGIQGTADKVVELAASAVNYIVIESGMYKNVSGDNKGKILIKGTADVKISATVLP